MDGPVAPDPKAARRRHLVLVVGPPALLWCLLLFAPSSIGLLTRALVGIIASAIWPAWVFIRSEQLNR